MNSSSNQQPPKTREEWLARIRKTSKDEVILDEMKRLGYWPEGQDIPHNPESDIRRIGELERELSAIRTELSRLGNEEALRKALYKKRLEEARKKREETKKRREAERLARAEAWKKNKENNIIYLGENVSQGLNNTGINAERLAQYNGIPTISTPLELATAMKITVGELRFLAFSRKVSKTTHYKRFYIPKKTGGQRLISAPMPRLKEAQLWILENILDKIPLHEAARGFREGYSIVTNAEPHIGKEVVINIDMKDFFPTLSYKRVKGMFQSLGYSEAVATILGLICTEPEIDEVTIDNERYYVMKGQRHLPQGAPSSPAITNIICRRLDKRLFKLSQIFEVTYTRYADDITFSGTDETIKKISKLLAAIRGIIEHEGFQVHPDKTRILHKGRKQEVTGLVVNKGVSVNRKTMRRLRATIFQLEKDGIKGKKWGRSPDVIASVEGYAHFVSMVNKDRGTSLLNRIDSIKKRIKYKKQVTRRYPKRTPSWKIKPDASTTMKPQSAETGIKKEKDKKPWWKFW